MKTKLGLIVCISVGTICVATGAALVVQADDAVPSIDAAASLNLTAKQISTADVLITNSPELSALSSKHPYQIESTGSWTTVGDLSGSASLIDFGEVVTLKGQIPTVNVLNAVSEDKLAKGASLPDKLDIRYEQQDGELKAREFSVLLDFGGKVRSITPVPARVPSSVLSSKISGPVPPTMPATGAN